MKSSDSSNPKNDTPALPNEEINADQSQDDRPNIENEEEEAPQESFISTTAGGDGLEFDKRLGNIFNEIEAIKQGN